MKRREFTNLAVAGIGVSTGALLSSRALANRSTTTDSQSTDDQSNGYLKPSNCYSLTGTSTYSDANTAFNSDGESDGLIASYTSSGVSLMAFHNDGTGVVVGQSVSTLLRTWNGSPENLHIQKKTFGYLFSYTAEAFGSFKVQLTKDSYISIVTSGAAVGQVFLGNTSDDTYLYGELSAENIKLTTYPFFTIGDSGSSIFKMESQSIYGRSVPSRFKPEYPDLNLMPETLLLSYQALFNNQK
jgi:hypothetical protein